MGGVRAGEGRKKSGETGWQCGAVNIGNSDIINDSFLSHLVSAQQSLIRLCEIRLDAGKVFNYSYK